MPLNDCIQCTDLGAHEENLDSESLVLYRIKGYDPDHTYGGCNWEDIEDCQKAKIGYGRDETSVADLLNSSGFGKENEYEPPEYIKDLDDSFQENTDYQEDDDKCPEDDEIYSHVLKKCVKNEDETFLKCGGWADNIDPEDTEFIKYTIWSIRQQKCVDCNVGQTWDDEHQECQWINDEFDDLPDEFPCDGIECGTGGRCVEGVCECDAGYEHEDESDLTSKCVKSDVEDANAIDPDTVNTFDLEDEWKINNNIEYSFAALAFSFNPSHNTSAGGGWKAHINKDLPVLSWSSCKQVALTAEAWSFLIFTKCLVPV